MYLYVRVCVICLSKDLNLVPILYSEIINKCYTRQDYMERLVFEQVVSSQF